ncbi:hypothetical protein L6164_001517 [Bauhinia variegata]|uniref:Uncharacterized protein n=1 Tax=Bauhinia variegata TaxID=167791 RepID=A0ACB9Q9S2_BAUVA|nr:hypothetical protein L6164_001517 [Bauhinia variegata]
MRIFYVLPCLLSLMLSIFTTPSTSSIDSFIYGGCSQVKFWPGSAYENQVNSLLTSVVNSAMYISYNNFTSQSQGSSSAVYGLFQCRGDLNSGDCSRCVDRAVSQLGTICPGSAGGALQLDGCFVKYDNTTFLGVEDKTVVLKKCGPSMGLTSDSLTHRDAVLAYLGTSIGSYKVSNSGNVYGVAQCTGDLSTSKCLDCVSDAVQRLRTECGAADWGDMYLAKCYARYSERGDHSRGGKDDDNNKNDEEIQKTLAILIGLIAGVALLIVFLSFLGKVYGKDREGK